MLDFFDNFRIIQNEPIDTRFVVNDENELESLTTSGVVYDGLIVWVKSLNGYRIYNSNISSADKWEPIRKDLEESVDDIDERVSELEEHSSVGNKTYYQAAAPSSAISGDLWFCTSDAVAQYKKYKLYRSNGSAWQELTDDEINNLKTITDDLHDQIESIKASSGIGNIIFNQSTQPEYRGIDPETHQQVALVNGDMWFDSSNDVWNIYTDGLWETVTDGGGAETKGAVASLISDVDTIGTSVSSIKSDIYDDDGNSRLTIAETNILTLDGKVEARALKTVVDSLSTTVEQQSGEISVQSQKISLVVTRSSSDEDKINTAGIVAAINDSGSSALINADKIELSGVTEFVRPSDLSTTGGTTIIDGSLIKTGKIEAQYLSLENVAPKSSAISSVTVEYALSTSPVNAPSSGWSEIAPSWTENMFMWQRTSYTTADGGDPIYKTPTCIQGAKGDAGTGVNIKVSADDCTELGDAYIDPDGILQVLVEITPSKVFQAAGEIKGPKGDQGIPGPTGPTGQSGQDGQNGNTSYFHIKYSYKESPTKSSDMSDQPATYIGTYVDFNSTSSTIPSTYTWSRFEGAQGEKGDQGIKGENGANGENSYLHIAYANSSDGSVGFSISDSSNKQYIGQYVDTISSDSTDYTKYKWTKTKGETGTQGISVESIITEYYLSNSSATTSGGTWTTECPVWETNKYYFVRNKITFDNDDTSYTTPVYDGGLTSANSYAFSAEQLEAALREDLAVSGRVDISGGNIMAASIGANQIAANAIISGKIASGAITSDKLSADAISVGDKFKVDKDEETVELGGFVVTDSAIYSNVTSIDDILHDGIYVGTNGIRLGKGNFNVDIKGNLKCNDAYIYGNTAINGDYVRVKQLEAWSTLSAKYINSSSITTGLIRIENVDIGSVPQLKSTASDCIYNATVESCATIRTDDDNGLQTIHIQIPIYYNDQLIQSGVYDHDVINSSVPYWVYVSSDGGAVYPSLIQIMCNVTYGSKSLTGTYTLPKNDNTYIVANHGFDVLFTEHTKSVSLHELISKNVEVVLSSDNSFGFRNIKTNGNTSSATDVVRLSQNGIEFPSKTITMSWKTASTFARILPMEESYNVHGILTCNIANQGVTPEFSWATCSGSGTYTLKCSNGQIAWVHD